MTPRTAIAAALDALAPASYRQYICHACGHIYDEAEGDPDGGLPPGTRFADIPDDWACPLCGLTKQDFSPYDPPSLDALRAALAPAAPAAGGRCEPGVVIVGAGRAGWQMAEALRALDARLPLTLVTTCSGDVYDKPLLSVALARRLDPGQLVRETGAAAARRLNLRLLPHTHAIRICPGTRQLRTTRGTLPYAQLVLAHGAQAMPPAGVPAALCWRVNHLQAYQRLRSALGTAPQEVVIVGAGLVGSELANDLALGGHRVTLLDVQPEPLARWQAEQAGARVLQAWQGLPIRFVGGVRIAQVDQQARRLVVTTACGQRFEADQLIAATGLQTPDRLARSAGLAWQDGIAVNPDTLRTSVPGIHALGDCISLRGQTSRFIEPIARQARTIAADIHGDAPVPYECRPAAVRLKTTSLPLTLH